MNIMKVTLLTLILTAIVLNLNARSFPKDTLRGKNASYERVFILSAIKMRNIQTRIPFLVCILMMVNRSQKSTG